MADPVRKLTPADRMRSRVNPEYDRDVDPEEQEYAYVNPVALNNDLIVIGNELLTLTEGAAEAEKAITSAKLKKRKAERELEDMEEELLRDSPLAPSEAKSLKTISAAVARRAKEAGLLTTRLLLLKEVRQLEDVIDKEQTTVRTARLYIEAGERVSDNIRSHLSWVKDDRKRT